MNRVDLKRRILGNRVLVRIPWLARELLLSPHPGGAFARPVLDAAAGDAALAAALRTEAKVDAAVPLDDALAARLDAPALRRAALRAWAGAGARVKGHGLDHHAFWITALRAADFAESIALQIQSPNAHLAFATGLLSNLGRPALDLAVDGGYQHRIEGPAADGLPLLESEQQAYGADHTQAGKWLAEHWRLPHALTNAIWLHHLPPEALDEIDESGGLAEIAALAAILALVRPASTPSAPAVARAERLGMTPESLARLVTAANDSAPLPVPRREDALLAGGPDTTIRQGLAYWQSLAEVLQQVRPPMPLDDALTHIARGVRQAFGLAPAIAYALDSDGHPAACRWRDAHGAVQPLALDATGAASPLVGLIARLAETRGTAAVPGLICAPFLADGEVLGQLVFEAEALATFERETVLAEVQRFAAACGNALQRCIEHDRISAGHEKMAAALQRLEHAHRQSLRNARLDSAATLASGAAHQLNNPLAIVSGRAQLLLNRTEDGEHIRGLETILRESRRAARILTELMQFARPGEPKFAEADGAAILRNTADALRPMLEERGISIVEDMAAPLPRVPLDGAQMEQVFTHVLRNAAQSMRDGGTIYLRARPSGDARSLVLQIDDTGPGIRPEVMDHIFEPFFTASDDAEPHTGLGLAVSRAVIDRHHGTITLHNNPYKGCTCTITLSTAERRQDLDLEPVTAPPPRFYAPARPGGAVFRETAPPIGTPAVETPPAAKTADPPVERESPPVSPVSPEPPQDNAPAPEPEPAAPEPVAAKPALPVPEESRSTAKQVLFADRDEDLREVLAEALRSRGYAVRSVPDGLEAHAAILTGKFDLVIAELSLPALSGRDLLDQVRSRFPELPLVILVGAAAADDEIESLTELGADLCLRKPFGLETLLSAMARLLETSRLAKGA